MKKLLLFAVLMLTVTTFAQVTGPKLNYASVGYLLSTPSHATTDTIATGVTKNQFGIAGGSNVHITFQPTFTKISGTVGGTAKIQGSVDGVTYNDVGSPSSVTLTDVASQTFLFTVVPSTCQYYKLVVTPSGTQSTKVKTPVLVRKY